MHELQDAPVTEELESVTERGALGAIVEVDPERRVGTGAGVGDVLGQFADHRLLTAALERGERQEQQDDATIAQSRPLVLGAVARARAARRDSGPPSNAALGRCLDQPREARRDVKPVAEQFGTAPGELGIVAADELEDRLLGAHERLGQQCTQRDPTLLLGLQRGRRGGHRRVTSRA